MFIIIFFFISQILSPNTLFASNNEINISLENCPLLSRKHQIHTINKTFVQKRFINGISKTIDSEGLIDIYPEGKIILSYIKPIASTMTITENSLNLNYTEDGKEISRLIRDEETKALTYLLFALHNLKDNSNKDNPPAATKLEEKYAIKCTKVSAELYELLGKPKSNDKEESIVAFKARGSNSPHFLEFIDGDSGIVQILINDLPKK